MEIEVYFIKTFQLFSKGGYSDQFFDTRSRNRQIYYKDLSKQMQISLYFSHRRLTHYRHKHYPFDISLRNATVTNNLSETATKNFTLFEDSIDN